MHQQHPSKPRQHPSCLVASCLLDRQRDVVRDALPACTVTLPAAPGLCWGHAQLPYCFRSQPVEQTEHQDALEGRRCCETGAAACCPGRVQGYLPHANTRNPSQRGTPTRNRTRLDGICKSNEEKVVIDPVRLVLDVRPHHITSQHSTPPRA